MYNKNKFRWPVVIVLLCAWAYTLSAQKIALLHFDIDNGLPSNKIYSLSDQRNGYIWLATDKGISRFNGLDYTNYSTFDSLPDNDIFNVIEDYEGRMWCSTFSGAMCYYKDNRFYTAQNTKWLRLPFSSAIMRLLIQNDSSLNVVFNDQTKFAVVRHDSLRIVPIESVPRQELLYVRTLSNGNFELYYRASVVLIGPDGKKISVIRDWSKDNHVVIHQLSLNDLSLYLCSLNGLYDFNGRLVQKFRKTKIDITFQVPITVYDGTVFTGLVDHFAINDSILVPTGEHVTGIQKDRDNNFWISTLGNGIFYLSKHFRELKVYASAYDGKVIYARWLNGSLFFVTGNGTVYEKKDNKIRVLLPGSETEIYLIEANFYLTDEGALIKALGESFSEVPNLIKGGKTYVTKDIRLTSGVKKIFEDKDNIYVAEITSMDRISKRPVTDKKQPQDGVILGRGGGTNERIFGRAIDTADNSIWFTKKDSVFSYQEGVVTYQRQFGKTTLRFISIMGAYLVGLTEDNKLVIYSNYKNDRIQRVVIEEPDCIWDAFCRMNEHTAIITTNNYYRMLTLLPPEEGKPRYRIQAVENPFVPAHAEYIASDGKNGYFFRKGTITEVPVKVLLEETKPPQLLFTQVNAGDSSYNTDSLVSIPYAVAKAIRIKFDNISFVAKDLTVEYSITKSGEDDWVPITGNEINMNVPGWGTYQVKIRAKTVSSRFSTPEQLILVIKKPFWAEWWFVLIAVVILGLGLWLVIRFFIRRKLRKNEIEYETERKFQQSEYKALNALMNPHFIFNSLNNIQGLINKDSKETANEYLVIFSRLVRQNMINISKGFISLEQELNLVQNYLSLEKMRFKELVNYSISIDKEVEIDSIMIPPLLIQPVVENAIVHGLLPRQSEESCVTISVTEEDDKLYVSVRDNGIGLTQSFKNKQAEWESYGLLNLNKRIEHLKKIHKNEMRFEIREIFDEHGQSCGTEATMIIDL